MSPHLIGYACVSTNQQDLSSQQAGLKALGVPDKLVYVYHVLTGMNSECPGLQQALATCRAGDTLAITKLDRLARSLPDARDIVENLTKLNIKLSLGGSNHDPTDFIRARTREGMQIAKAEDRLRGKQPKVSPAQVERLVVFHHGEQHTSAKSAERSGIALSTVYRIVQRTPNEPDKAGPQVQGPSQNNELPA